MSMNASDLALLQAVESVEEKMQANEEGNMFDTSTDDILMNAAIEVEDPFEGFLDEDMIAYAEEAERAHAVISTTGIHSSEDDQFDDEFDHVFLLQSSQGTEQVQTDFANLEVEPELEVDDEGQGSIYCVCQRGSSGKMIGCDGENCENQWFHYSCVGITSTPEGDWYCPFCPAPRDDQNQN